MLGLTSRFLLTMSVVGAVVVPLLAVWLWPRSGASLALDHARRLGMVALAQLLALMAGFLFVNDKYGFYTSWGDLAGQRSLPAPISINGLQSAHQGSLRVFTVHGRASTQESLVWLPPQYREPAYAHYRFPVVMFLTGQPSSPATVFQEFNFGQVAAQQIAAHRVRPFVAVFPPLMIHPPWDTECTDVPHGPQALQWLARDVPTAVDHAFRVQASGHAWTVMGWSTGGFCAAKLVIARGTRFSAAVSFGGYYQPLTDRHTGSLFDGIRADWLRNDPMWLYSRHGIQGDHLLMITGRQDHESWRSTAAMLRATRGDPNVSYVCFPTGGHNYADYRPYLAPALAWASRLQAPGTSHEATTTPRTRSAAHRHARRAVHAAGNRTHGSRHPTRAAHRAR